MRKRKPMELLSSNGKRNRKKEGLSLLASISCPVLALIDDYRAPPKEFLHTHKSQRLFMRSFPSLSHFIPSERQMIDLREELAKKHGTATDIIHSSIFTGAYITDPVLFVQSLTKHTPHSLLAIGGDCGGGHTKLGVTYTDATETQRFACLFVFAGKDCAENLNALKKHGITKFIGLSSGYNTIWEVLQALRDKDWRHVCLNGDWPFISGILGLGGSSATNPCPICTVDRKKLLADAEFREPFGDKTTNPSPSKDWPDALLYFEPSHIVPMPLHVFLGLSNRIIDEAHTELFGEDVIQEAVKSVRTIHSAGCGGAADRGGLQGPELRKYIDGDVPMKQAAAQGVVITAPTRESLAVLQRWLTEFHTGLLRTGKWTPDDIKRWRELVDEVLAQWQKRVGKPFPKLHLLKHTLHFAEHHRYLGRYSEQALESFHGKFNYLYHRQHRNKAKDDSERFRRSLAHAALVEIQRVI